MMKVSDGSNGHFPLVQSLHNAGVVSLLNSEAILQLSLGHLTECGTRLDEALPLARELGDRRAEARALDALGLLRRAQGALVEASELHLTLIALARESGDLRTEAMGRINLGHISNLRADHITAERAYMDALGLLSGRGDLAAESAALANLGEVSARMGRFQDALDHGPCECHGKTTRRSGPCRHSCLQRSRSIHVARRCAISSYASGRGGCPVSCYWQSRVPRGFALSAWPRARCVWAASGRN